MEKTSKTGEAAPYPSVQSDVHFPTMEQEVLAFWNEQGVFEASVEGRPAQNSDGSSNAYVFYDGPPFANGLPHHGHLLTGYVKDAVARYQTMRGKRVDRRFGWDCHGLPAEMEAEKQLGVSGRQEIIAHGIDKFNDHCRTSVMRYRDEWEAYVNRQARWVDFENDYKTMDTPYMESVLWAFSELHKKGLIYEGFKVMPYSWAAETVLSNAEIRLDDATREKVDKAVTVAFKLKEKPEGAPEADEYYVLAWTTTPWTLPSNLALAASGEMGYVAVTVEKEHLPPLAGGGRRGAVATSDFSRDKYTTRDQQALEHAKDLRVHATEAEKKLWKLLRSKQLEGCKFRRQHSVGNYITDFACVEKGLIIELDGGQHDAAQSYDDARTAFLEEAGYRVLRFWNNEVLENSEGVYDKIVDAVKAPHPTSPRKRGEELRACYIFAEWAYGFYKDALNIEPTPEEIERIAQSLKQSGEESYPLAELPIIPGKDLIGLSYEPLFPYFADQPNAFRVLDGSDFIEEGSGTGIVHMAPGFGEDDQRICAENDIDVVVPVNEQGRYTDAMYDLEGDAPLSLKGLNVIAETEGKCDAEPYTEAQLEKYGLANLRIINWLKLTGHLVKQEDYAHNYPHCWRTDKPIIYKAMSSWFVDVPKIRDRMVELNQQINWIPNHIRSGRFGKWLENAREWSISRSRFWGCPIPVWRSDNPDNDRLYVFGSIAELEEFFGVEVSDLHKPFIDTLTKPDPENPDYTIRRVDEVFDCWFESGSMPYAQVHYPFENKDWFEANFPADFIVEYEAQTRGWFYNMMVLSVGLFDSIPFKNCICHGVVLDNQGRKLSKRLKNYMDPNELFDTYGSDALRWFMLSSTIMRGNELFLDPEGAFIRDAVRLYIKPLWNAYHFFCLYANADGIQAEYDLSSDNLMDRYILAKLKTCVDGVREALDAYDTPTACSEVTAFLEVLNNWYIRRNRARFWKDEQDADKLAAYNTLYSVLHTLCRVVAPLLPQVSEAVYRGVSGETSVHLTDYPTELDALGADIPLMQAMDRVQDICNTAHAVRNEVGIRIRQPLAALTVYGANIATQPDYFKTLIADETNVKEVIFSDDLEQVATRKLKINFPVVGKRLGPKMKAITAASRNGAWAFNDNGSVAIEGETLSADEFEFTLESTITEGAGALAAQDGLVVLDTTLTEALTQEGIARDVVRLIQQSRKEAGLEVSDRIALGFAADEETAKAITQFADYICEQTLVESLGVQQQASDHLFTQESGLTIWFRKSQKEVASA